MAAFSFALYYNLNKAFWPDFGGFFQKINLIRNFSLNTSPDVGLSNILDGELGRRTVV